MPEDSTTAAPAGVVGGYVASRTFPDAGVPAGKLTHVFYAFADLPADGRISVDGEAASHLRELVSLTGENPDLDVLLSVGGWGRSEHFPAAAASPGARRAFAESAVAAVREHDLDGLDLDWEFPDEDEREAYTQLVKATRYALDEAGEVDGRDYLLTAALSASAGEMAGVDLRAVAPHLDLVNVMTYDMHHDAARDDEIDEHAHHANLYTSSLNRRYSVNRAVESYTTAGVPPEKLVVGAAFYSRGAVREGYATLAEEYVDASGWLRHWDADAKAPYLERGDEFVSYDDPASLREKVAYVRENGLAGVVFWEHGRDPSGTLLETLHDAMTE